MIKLIIVINLKIAMKLLQAIVIPRLQGRSGQRGCKQPDSSKAERFSQDRSSSFRSTSQHAPK